MGGREQPDPRRDRPWLILLAITLAAALAAAPWLIDRWGVWTTSLQDEAAEAVAAQAAEDDAGASPSVLVVLADETGVTRSVALLTKPPGEPGLLALAPPQLFVLLPGFGEFPLSQATVFEDVMLTGLAFENAFGVRADHVVLLSGDDLAAALGGDLAVTLPSPVIRDTADGAELVADAGVGSHPADVVVTLLTVQGRDEPLVWLERQAAVWEAIITTADAGISVAIGARGDSGAAEVVDAVAASGPQVALLPVERFAAAGDTDGFTVDGGGLAGFVSARVPHLALGPEPRPRVEVLNGNGRFQATRPVVEVLVRGGFSVIRTDNADRFDFAETLIIAQGNDNRPSAERAATEIGLGSLQLELTSPSGVVDLSIIVGEDVPTGGG